jgi:hypothetical protein
MYSSLDMFRVHTPIIRSIRCWVAAYGFMHRVFGSVVVLRADAFLHMKKHQINLKLYRLHLSLANTWGDIWHLIQDTIEDKLQRNIGSNYKTLDDKLHRLAQQKTITPKRAPHLLSQSSKLSRCACFRPLLMAVFPVSLPLHFLPGWYLVIGSRVGEFGWGLGLVKFLGYVLLNGTFTWLLHFPSSWPLIHYISWGLHCLGDRTLLWAAGRLGDDHEG